MHAFDGRWVSSIDGPDKRGQLLGLSDTRGKGIRAFTYSLPDDELTDRDMLAVNDERMEPFFLGRAYYGSLCYVPANDAWVEFYHFAGRMEMLSATGAVLKAGSVPFRWLPHVEPSADRGGRVIFGANNPRTRHAYQGCSATDRYIYGLYLGHLSGENAATDYFNRLPYGEIHVFDLSLRFVRAFVLDHATSVFAVVPGDSLLFSVKEDSTGAGVRRTRLPIE